MTDDPASAIAQQLADMQIAVDRLGADRFSGVEDLDVVGQAGDPRCQSLAGGARSHP